MLDELETPLSKTVKNYPQGFKLIGIIDKLAWDLLLILRQSLKQEVLDSDHLKLHILMTLSNVAEPLDTKKTESIYRNNYVKKLLFRDYNAPINTIWHTFHLPKTDKECARTIKIHEEAITYLSYVLERRLSLAQNLKDKPTNLHSLFEVFSQFSTLHPDWKKTTLCRHDSIKPIYQDRSYFKHSANVLAKQLKKLGIDFGDISHRRREQYGAIGLFVGECVTEVAEEMSLFDVLEALPLPLNITFMNDANVQKRFVRVIDSLNERYKLLRACGLKPDDWIERKSPSIAVLKELKKLRCDAENYLKSGVFTIQYQAYRNAFNENMQQKQKKKYAHVFSFDEFLSTDYGVAMMNCFTLSLDQPLNNDAMIDDYALYDAIADPDSDQEAPLLSLDLFDDDLDWVQYLIDTRPTLFSDVMIVFFQQAITSHRPLTTKLDERSLLADGDFQKLLQSDLDYCNLDDEALLEQLINQAEKIITQGLAATTVESSPSAQLSLVSIDD